MKRRQAEKIAKNPRQRRLTILRAVRQGAFGLLDPLPPLEPTDPVVERLFRSHLLNHPLVTTDRFVNPLPA